MATAQGAVDPWAAVKRARVPTAPYEGTTMIPPRAYSSTAKIRSTAHPCVPGGLRCYHARKIDLVTLGAWAIATGRGWLVQAVHVAL